MIGGAVKSGRSNAGCKERCERVSCEKERGKTKPGGEKLFMPSEQAPLARLTSLLEFGSGTGHSGTTPKG